MKYASFKYDISMNLGDQIQTLAAEQFLPSIDLKINRDSLKFFQAKERHLIIMNGWFSEFPESCLPSSNSIVPVFIGFHMTSSNQTIQAFLKPEYIDYFKLYEPIGCRDRKTQEILSLKGIKSFYSKCLTLTFPTRETTPKNGKIFIVDAFDIPVPNSLRKEAYFVSHSTHDFYGDQIKTSIARKMLETYRNSARLVITTKLHCAMPCIAMGIPVIFFGNPDEYRVSILKDLGLKINKKPSLLIKNIYKSYSKLSKYSSEHTFLKDVDWNPKPLNVEKEKKALIEKTKALVSERLSK